MAYVIEVGGGGLFAKPEKYPCASNGGVLHYIRDSEGVTPFQVAPPGFTGKLVFALGLAEIDPDELSLTPGC